MKKIKQFFVFAVSAILAVATLSAFVACEGGTDEKTSEYEVVVSTEELVVVKANEANVDATLYSVMVQLQTEGKLTFTESNGFISSVNGVENPADYSSCWMIYTDLERFNDVVYATTEYGSYTYENKTYASAAYGAKELPVIGGYTYILHYDTF